MNIGDYVTIIDGSYSMINQKGKLTVGSGHLYRGKVFRVVSLCPNQPTNRRHDHPNPDNNVAVESIDDPDYIVYTHTAFCKPCTDPLTEENRRLKQELETIKRKPYIASLREEIASLKDSLTCLETQNQSFHEELERWKDKARISETKYETQESIFKEICEALKIDPDSYTYEIIDSIKLLQQIRQSQATKLQNGFVEETRALKTSNRELKAQRDYWKERCEHRTEALSQENTRLREELETTKEKIRQQAETNNTLNNRLGQSQHEESKLLRRVRFLEKMNHELCEANRALKTDTTTHQLKEENTRLNRLNNHHLGYIARLERSIHKSHELINEERISPFWKEGMAGS